MTLFTKIINNEIESKKIYEDDYIIVIEDINPQAPIHVLVIPKKEIKDLSFVDIDTMNHCLEAIKHVAKILKVDETGYRLVTNIGSDGGQSIPHLHFHLLGGTRLTHELN